MSGENSRTPDAVRRLTDNVVGGADAILVTGRDATGLAFDASKEAASSAIDIGKSTAGVVLDMGKTATNVYITATMRAINLGSDVIKSIGEQVPDLPSKTKRQFFGNDEPSLGDRPKDTE